jgi:hypothetical protein
MSDCIPPPLGCQEEHRVVKYDVNSFNADIYHLVEMCLTRIDFQAFLHASKQVYDEYIGHRYLRLGRKYSLLYYHDDGSFRERILSLMLDTRKQLSLNLRNCSNITDVSGLSGVHTLRLSRCSKITDVSALGGVHTLHLSGCSKITDVSALGGVHTLHLSDCSIIMDVSALGGVHTLDLSRCSNIMDVSALGGVHFLKLSHCSNITDVSALGGVHTLNSYLTAPISRM